MGRDTLGDFEQQVLWTVLRLGRAAYSASIVEELERRTGREVAPAAVYIALRRLEEKGLAASMLRAAPDDDGGRARRYFEVLDEGRMLLHESRRRLERLWDGVDAVEEGV